MSAMFLWAGKETGYDVIVIGPVVLAELRLYWLSCSVLTEFVIHDSDCF